MITKFKIFEGILKPKKPVNPADPFDEEYWENPNDIMCASCGQVILPSEDMFILFGQPVHNTVHCTLSFQKKKKMMLSNVLSMTYKDGKRKLKKLGYFDKKENE